MTFSTSVFAQDIIKSFKLYVNYNLSIDKAIAVGNYSQINSHITEKNFPTIRSGVEKIEVVIVNIDSVMYLEDVPRELDRMGFRPADLRELLAFGARYPKVQRQYNIFALGSFWDWRGFRSVPNLRG